MAQLKMFNGSHGNVPSKPVREKRVEALERLLLLACTLLPDDLSELGEDADTAQDMISEAAFWIDFEPRGAKVFPTSPELRLGWKDLQAQRAAYAPELGEGDTLVPVAPVHHAPVKKAHP